MKKFALICGASGEIGQAIAKELSASGWSLYLHFSRAQDTIEELIAELSTNYPEQEFIPIQADFLDEAAADIISSQVYGVQSVIFAGGHAKYGLLEDHTRKDLRALWLVHVETPLLIIQKLTAKLRQQDSSYIIFLSSIWGEAGGSFETVYSAVKGAQNSFVKGFAKEVAASGIRINAIAPGIIDTKMNAHLEPSEVEEISADIPLGRFGEPKEVAQLAAFLVSGQADYITGQILRINGGWYI